MIKFLIQLFIMILLWAFVGAATNLVTVMLLENVMELIGTVAFLIVFTVILLLIFVFFFSIFNKRFREKTEIKMHRVSWKERLSWLLASVTWVFAATFILSSFRVLLHVAEIVNPNIFWCLIVVFMITFFVSAYKQDKKEKRLSNTQTNWWQ
ncbi:MAG TPA: hypothetical protein VF556_16360 [Pyrinomonadaceae bacterium]